jgi:hypothetical protein
VLVSYNFLIQQLKSYELECGYIYLMRLEQEIRSVRRSAATEVFSFSKVQTSAVVDLCLCIISTINYINRQS